MTFKTKFKPGDTIYLLEHNQVRHTLVKSVSISHYEETGYNPDHKCITKINYGIMNTKMEYTTIEEAKCFKSKKALLSSL